MYVLKTLEHIVTIETIDVLKLLKVKIKINDFELYVSAAYRSHDINKIKFNKLIESYLNKSNNLINHFIVGDFNMNTRYHQ